MKYVYILKAGQEHYKVGVATNVSGRVANIQTSNGNKIYIVTTKLCNNYIQVERSLHRKLKAMGSGGGTEWFVLEPEDVVRLCIMLHTEPEIDVYANVDLNTQLTQERLRFKSLEKKLDSILNIVQKPRSNFNKVQDTNFVIKTVAEEADILQDAIEVIKKADRASTSFLQRKLSIGYGRAARLIEQLEEQGIVGPADGSKPRAVLVGNGG